MFHAGVQFDQPEHGMHESPTLTVSGRVGVIDRSRFVPVRAAAATTGTKLSVPAHRMKIAQDPVPGAATLGSSEGLLVTATR